MKLLFICGSLNPGRDGVGDYTRQLAKACVELGHECLLVSLCDCVNETNQTEGIQYIRRKDQLQLTPVEQDEFLKKIIQWAPDWCSLQMVCFAFNPRGFVHYLFRFLERIPPAIPRHIMFHELWVRQCPVMPFKLRILGLLQRWQILRAVNHWGPTICHSSNPLYQSLLASNGVSARRLPLFGNIPIAEADRSVITPLLPWFPAGIDERIVIVPFSQLDRWEVVEAFDRLHALAEAAGGLKLRIVQVGLDRNGEQRWEQIQSLAKQWGWSCNMLGPQDAAVVSQLMLSADIGLNSAHIQISQKSGAVISMLEHGLQVICAGINPESRAKVEMPNEERLLSINDTDDVLVGALTHPKKQLPSPFLLDITKQFISDLTLN